MPNNKFPLPTWKSENPATYTKMQLSQQITKLRRSPARYNPETAAQVEAQIQQLEQQRAALK